MSRGGKSNIFFLEMIWFMVLILLDFRCLWLMFCWIADISTQYNFYCKLNWFSTYTTSNQSVTRTILDMGMLVGAEYRKVTDKTFSNYFNNSRLLKIVSWRKVQDHEMYTNSSCLILCWWWWLVYVSQHIRTHSTDTVSLKLIFYSFHTVDLM